MIHHVEITDEMDEWAVAKCLRKMEEARSSYCDDRAFGSDPDRMLTGFLGEIAVMRHLGVTEDADTRDYDFIHNGFRFDVKTSGTRSDPRRMRRAWPCLVNETETGFYRQQCDYYIFARVRESTRDAWIIGAIKTSRFYELAKMIEQGEPLFPGGPPACRAALAVWPYMLIDVPPRAAKVT